MFNNFKLCITLFLLFYAFTQSPAQDRYLDALFDSVEVYTYTYIVKNGKNLDLDIYTP